MARTARLKSSTGNYHIMMRGINRQNIFLDDEDKDQFLRILHGALTYTTNLSGRPSGQYRIYAYALMGNHFHLLVRVVSGDLSEFVKKIASGYVRYFNNKYKRDGHLFKERFKSEPCETFNYFCILMGYIHQNPIKHGFAKTIDSYRYTSWGEYVGKPEDSLGICDVDYVLSKMTIEEIKECIVEMLPANIKCIEVDKKDGEIADESIVSYILNKYGLEDPMKIKDMKQEEKRDVIDDLLDLGGGVRQISRITGVNAMVISRRKALQSILSPL